MKVLRSESEAVGVVIEDLDLSEVTEEQVAELRRLVYDHKLIVFRHQDMGTEEYLRMARRFGRPQVYFQDHYHHPAHPEIFVSSNVPENGRKVGVSGTGRFWHTDYQFFDEPLSTVFMYPQVLPSPGARATVFVDMERVWEDLSEELRVRLEGAHAFHEVTWYYKVQPSDIDRALIDLVKSIRRESPGAVHPMVIRHPVTGKRSLYVSEGFTSRVLGLPVAESRALLEELFDLIERSPHRHVHTWQEGDVLFWDNRGLIHRAMDQLTDEPSKSYRIGVYDEFPFYEMPGNEAGNPARPSDPDRLTASDLAS